MKKKSDHARFLDTLPISSLPKKDIASLLSSVEMFKRIKESGRLVLSFSASANENITSSKQQFISHFKHPSISIAEVPSCLSPIHCRMNMTLDLNLFDAFEMFTGQELLDEFRRYNKSTKLTTTSAAVVVGMSRALKSVLVLMSDENGNLLQVDRDTRDNGSFNVNSIGYFIADYFTGYVDKDKQWFPSSWSKKQKDSFIWLDGKKDVFSKTTQYYQTLTSMYYGSFQIDMPVASSTAEIALLQPVVEMNMMRQQVDDAKLALDAARKKYEMSKGLVEKVLVAYDMQLEE